MACRERRSAGWECGQSSFTVRRVVSGGPRGQRDPQLEGCCGGRNARVELEMRSVAARCRLRYVAWLEAKLPWSWRGREGGEDAPAEWDHAGSCRKDISSLDSPIPFTY